MKLRLNNMLMATQLLEYRARAHLMSDVRTGPELICTWTYILFGYRQEKLIHQIRGSDLRLTNFCESPG